MTDPRKPIGGFRTRSIGDTTIPWRFWVGALIVYGHHRRRPWVDRVVDPSCWSTGALGVGVSFAPTLRGAR